VSADTPRAAFDPARPGAGVADAGKRPRRYYPGVAD
jgi:hypothetical protein